MKISQVLVKNTWLEVPGFELEHGWGNGYIGVPEGHPWFGVDYSEIDAEVHCGLTYSKMDSFGKGLWWIGFDTAHAGDNKTNCNVMFVAMETASLAKQAEAAC